MDTQATLLKALRDLMQAVERCEENNFSLASRINLAVMADAAAEVSVSYAINDQPQENQVSA
jgi:hypothetical protein